MSEARMPEYNGENVRVVTDPRKEGNHDLWVWVRGERGPCIHYPLAEGKVDELASANLRDLRNKLKSIDSGATKYLEWYNFNMMELSLALGCVSISEEDARKKDKEGILVRKVEE